MAILKDLIVNGVSHFIGKLTASTAEITDETVTTINGVTVGSSPKFTDTNNAVTQTATSTNSDYEVLFSVTADNTTRTEGARKNSNLKFNPSTGNLQATQLNGATIGSSPKFTDTTYESKTAASGGTAVSLVTTGEKYTWNNKSSLTLGTTSSTAYRGDYGNAAYAHGVTNKGSAFSSGLYKITTNSEGHVTAATAVQKSDITALGIPAQDTTYTPASADPIGPKSVAEVGTSAKYAREDHVHPTKMVPIATKTYTNVIATANDNNGGGFFYLKVRPTTYNTYWHVKTRVIATISGQAYYYTDTTFDVFGYDNAVSWYACLNKIKSTSYRPIYYNSVFLTNSTGYNNSCGHWIGINLCNSTNPTSSSYKRTLEVELLACDNCTAELQDSLITPTNIPNRASHTNWYTSTNTSYSNFNAAGIGLKQSGDSDTTSISNLIRNGGTYIADSALYRYQMLFQIDENTLTPLNNVSNSTATTKTMLTNVEFNPFGLIHYYSSASTVSANGNISAGALFYAYYGIDLRYTFNCGTSLTAQKPFYLVVTPTSNGKCKIASSSPWAQTLPSTNDGKWYILLGRTYGTYQLTLYPNHPVYFHDGISVKQILPPNVSEEKVFNVGSGQTYTTLRSGIEAAVQHLNSTVYVHPGEYDLITEFASEISTAQGFSGIPLYNGVHVIFQAGSYVKALFPENHAKIGWVKQFFSPFYAVTDDTAPSNCISDDYILENLTISASNCRYCVHDDPGARLGNYIHKYLNCHMDFLNNLDPPNYIQAIGGGLGEHGYIEIDGGDYAAHTTVGQPGYYEAIDMQWPISYHNCSLSTAQSDIIIKNVVLRDRGRFRFGYYGSSTKITRVVIAGCNTYSKAEKIDESWGGGAVDNIEVLDYTSNSSYYTQYVTVNTIPGADYMYIGAYSTGEVPVSAMIMNEYSGLHDMIIGLGKSGSTWVVFLKGAAPSTVQTKNIMVTWARSVT